MFTSQLFWNFTQCRLVEASWNVMAHAETRFCLSAKRSPFKSAGASVHSTTNSRDVRISGSNAGYTMFQGSVKSTGYPLHSPVSFSIPLPCVTMCHRISTGVSLVTVVSEQPVGPIFKGYHLGIYLVMINLPLKGKSITCWPINRISCLSTFFTHIRVQGPA